MRTINISDDSADDLFREMLSTDYLNLVDDIKKMEMRIESGEELALYEREDLLNWVKTVSAIDTLFDWYLTVEPAETIRRQSR